MVKQSMEIGYPHELILLTTRKLTSLKNGENSPLIDAYSNLFLILVGKTSLCQINSKHKYLELELLTNYKKKGYLLKKKINAHLSLLLDTYLSSAGSSNKLKTLENFLIFSLYFVIISDDLSLINNKILTKITSSNLMLQNTVTSNISNLILTLQMKDIDESKIHEILTTVNGLSDNWLKIYFSYKCFIVFENHKELFLINHYSILKALMKTYTEAFEEPHLSDQSIENLIKISSSLFICGYNTSLRINYQEKINYQETVLKQKSIINAYNSHYDEAMKLGKGKFSIPIQWYLLIVSFLILIISFFNIWAPLGISLGTIEFSIPVEFPIVIFISIGLLVPLIVKLFKAKKDISKKLNQGEKKNND